MVEMNYANGFSSKLGEKNQRKLATIFFILIGFDVN